ncbi:hypothetical protein CTAYLR_008657 [Chrysophaeum taylorii]|uniref:Phosphoglycerate mutase n=1 Tax=Chrysophaeum taylorii TaxID=2483200 RepID=A0AAD7XJU3_9STRA|nr:hypothetical protein CTAYLR_008657 [Chrysophaeum taylorii]
MPNRFYALRHGFSVANDLGIICSRWEHGRLAEYGLHAVGRSQAVEAAKEIARVTSRAVVFASDFARARETAEIVRAGLGLGEVYLQPLLRERDFGDFELTASENYEKVWEQDAVDASHTRFGVESAEAVLKRALLAVEIADKAFEDADVILVSHGDTLQIAQTAWSPWPVGQHRRLPHLDTCELRRLDMVVS